MKIFKSTLVLVLALVMMLSFAACGAPAADTTEEAATEEVAAPAVEEVAEEAALISVGIVNNPPSESGYRAANVADFEAVLTKENGNEVSTF